MSVVLATTLLASTAGWRADARAAPPVGLTAAFDDDARLGDSTALQLGLHVDTRRVPSPVTSVQLRYAASLGITTSGLGLATCRRTVREFAEVVVEASGLAGCPRNAVMARGTAVGEIRFGTKIIPEVGTINVLAGPLRQGRLGLVTFVEGWNPIGALLAYDGSVVPAPAPYGGALEIVVPQIPASYGATIALADLRLAVGSRDIVYHDRVDGRTVAYRPDGIALPARCPRGGFRFQALFRFHDGTRRAASAAIRCPLTAGS